MPTKRPKGSVNKEELFNPLKDDISDSNQVRGYFILYPKIICGTLCKPMFLKVAFNVIKVMITS